MEFAHHYHSSHPEKQNVVSGLKNVRRMIGLKIGSFFRPAQSRKGPKSRGKPGIKHVGVLLPLARRSFSACLPVRQGGGAIVFRCLNSAVNFISLVPDRNAVSEPYLPRDAPVAQIIYPMEIGF